MGRTITDAINRINETIPHREGKKLLTLVWVSPSFAYAVLSECTYKMLRSAVQKFPKFCFYNRYHSTKAIGSSPKIELPEYADVVIIGGGSAGCNALYHFGKRGIKAVLLEKSKIISGTTWHTAGLIWSIRGPSDVEMQILKVTRRVLDSLEEETGVNPGWINNGGLYIAHTQERLKEYKRLVTASKVFGIDARIISAQEAKELFPLLDENVFIGAVYAPGDGAVDPVMLTNALIKSAKNNGCKVFEECPVNKLITKKTTWQNHKILGVETPNGIIKTNAVLNASGAWSNDISNTIKLDIPLIPMKHAYVVTEPMDNLEGVPNIRDPDISLYFKIHGGCMSIGGYEQNPILLNSAPQDFSFSLYELDWNVFNAHMESMVRLIPELSNAGIRSTVCGPESFTPDHKPIMGEDPRCSGLFYSCGFNSAGMMLGGGCGEEIVNWITNGRPNKHMFSYDIRRFIPEQRSNLTWATERSHEAYAKNYSIIFPHDEPLSGRNLKIDPFHDLLLQKGAFMEERQGWERPGWFSLMKNLSVLPYDYGGYYELKKHETDEYNAVLEKEHSFDFSPYDNIICEEAMACRNNVALFDMSYFGKFYLCGVEAQKAADYLFTADTNCNFGKTIYTCMLNSTGGAEADCTVTVMESGSSGLIDPIFKDKGHYIVSGGMSAYHTWAHMNKVIEDNGFDVSLHDVTEQIGVLSIQGPNSRKVLESIVDGDVSKESLKFSRTKLVRIKNELVRVIRLSFVGELGFELHIPRVSCHAVYNAVIEAGKAYDMKLAGYRAMYSLSCEKGYHLWGSDLRSDDNPVEAGLGFTCRNKGNYIGKSVISQMRENGIKKRLVHFYVNRNVPLWGLEAIYRDNVPVGYVRRAEIGYTIRNVIARGYIEDPTGRFMTTKFLETGKYEIEVMGERYPATLHVSSPFDSQNKRLFGIYKNQHT